MAELNVDAKTAMIRSPQGETELLFEGDVVGKEHFSIISIRELAIELEGPPDNSGRKGKFCIPVIPIKSFGDM